MEESEGLRWRVRMNAEEAAVEKEESIQRGHNGSILCDVKTK